MNLLLRKPVTVDDKTVTSLTLRPLTWGDEIDAEVQAIDGADHFAALVAIVTGESIKVVQALSARDAVAIEAVFADQPFLEVPDGDQVSIALPSAITLGGEETTGISLREPTLGELIRARKVRGTAAQYLRLAMYTGGTSEALLRKAPRSLYEAVSGFLDRFMVAGPATGATSSPTSADGMAGHPTPAND